MRLVKSSRTLLPLALSAILATCAFAQERLDVQPNAVGEQLKNISIGSQPPDAAQNCHAARSQIPGTGRAKSTGQGSGARQSSRAGQAGRQNGNCESHRFARR